MRGLYRVKRSESLLIHFHAVATSLLSAIQSLVGGAEKIFQGHELRATFRHTRSEREENILFRELYCQLVALIVDPLYDDQCFF